MPKSSWLRAGFSLLLATATLSCAEAHTGTDQTQAGTDKIAPKLVRSLASGIARNVLVELTPLVGDDSADAGGVGVAMEGLTRDLEGLAPSVANPMIEADVADRASYYEAAQQAVLDAIDRREVTVLTRYQHVPYLFVNVSTLHGLHSLANRPEVLRLHEDRELEHQLAESLPLINQPSVAAAGKTGSGTAVAVLDTGCDYSRADFGSCSSAGASGCKVAYAADFATNDSALDDNGHGTNVSAIVLGVAPATKVLALDVFNGSTASASVILAGIDWTIQNRTTYNIVAMNMSLGSGSYNSVCSSDVFASALANARAAGIVPVVASGNNGYTSALASPACTPAALSVGAVYDANLGGISYSSCSDTSTVADKVTCFSNSASFLSMLAPGALITAGGYRMTGTSQAAPHVAGALAVVRSVYPAESLSAIIARLTDSGSSITDPRNNITKRRLDLTAAIRGSTTTDTTRPTGSVVINGNQAATNSVDVMLGVTAFDASGIDSMCVSNGGTCTQFQPFSSTLSWQLPTGEGVKTVRVAIKDAAGNQTVVTDSIKLDTKLPVGGTVRAVAKNGAVELTWTAANDPSGIAAYRVMAAPDTAPSCTDGVLIYNGTDRTFTHTGLTNGTLYGYRLCPVDGAGNIGAGSTASARPAPEFAAPTGTILVNGGKTSTRLTAVTLTLNATDPSGVARMCVSNTKTCTSWEQFSATKEWSLSTSKGQTTVYAWFEDSFANRSTAPVSVSVLVDPLPPTGISLTPTAGTGLITLKWPAGTDPSGITAYKLVSALGTVAPTSCSEGTKLYEGSDKQYTHTGLTKGSTYSYRLCATDGVGNVSLGVLASAIAR